MCEVSSKRIMSSRVFNLESATETQFLTLTSLLSVSYNPLYRNPLKVNPEKEKNRRKEKRRKGFFKRFSNS